MKNATIKKVILLLSCVLCLMFTGLFLANGKTVSNTANADAVSFTMDGGASLRLQNVTEAKYNGMRFSANVSKATYDSWEGAKYYMIIMPKSYEAHGTIDSEDSYVWDYADVGSSEAPFILTYDNPKVEGKWRVLYNKCNPVPLDSAGNVTDNPSAVASYELRATVVGMRAQNNATKYTAICVAQKADGSRVFATRAGATKRYRSILDVSIRAMEKVYTNPESDQYKMLKAYEDNYIEWYEEKYEEAPTYSYTVKTYYGGVEKNSYTVSGKDLHSTVDITPTNYTGQNVDLVYVDD